MAITLAEKYEQERQKRQQASKGLQQYLDKEKSSAFLVQDPWVEIGTPVHRPVPDGGHCKIVIFGAGFAGILSAVQMLQAGAAKDPSDILIVDPAGGYGGTWYWNRYPGLMCDVESYTYLPLLEETGYMPTRRFASGEEIRTYFGVLAKHYGLEGRGQFQSSGKTITWEKDHWKCDIIEHAKGSSPQTITINADFTILASGGFTYPKLPNTFGIETFKGQMLHTGRWNYDITGGSSQNPVLDKLQTKRVGIVGTGATAIQAVPELAKYAKELYVFQRTPSAVDFRNNRDTIPEDWESKIANKKGWHAERLRKLQLFTEQSNDLPQGYHGAEDGFYSMPSIKGSFGGPSDLDAQGVAEHLARLQALDDARSDKVRQQTLEIVKDQDTAQKLQAWYPGWCKRPTFHDEYLPTFNRPNVHLVDTDGKGLDGMTAEGIKVNGQEYPLDVIVWSTGYGNPLTESLAGKAEMAVIGKDGQDMDDMNKKLSLESLHGCMSAGFPNLFTTALSGAGVGVNQVQRLNEQGIHNAYIVTEAQRRADGKKVVIEPSEKACQEWGDEIQSAAHLTAGILACTPGYFSLEGDIANIDQDTLGKMGRHGLYGQGYLKYAGILEKWRADGKLKGLEVSTV
ncbi:FAD-binding monooxygenase ausC [Pseudocercospora fuligena]|uniref:FAD-binding monooxygenase ausC n=1 Tax=Pseudocercospora fuligena TaxID=685502 RepID=A0A8H6RQL8_9PEZI|nr:FAD-binding monooxygenase ausC [Pseudocercospora fuligena]